MPKTSIDAFVPEFQELFATIHRSQWAIGRRLIERGIMSDTDRTALGKKLSPAVGLGTMNKYAKVYTEFSQKYPDGPQDVAFGVFAELTRVSDVQWRDNFLKQHPKATVTFTERAVNKKLLEDRQGRGPRFNATAAMVLASEGAHQVIRADGRLQGDGTGDILFDGISRAQLVGPDLNGKYRLEFAV